MASHKNKFTPIAATVALSLGLVGCGSDNDNNVTVDKAVTYSSSETISFSTEVSGKAIKGALNNAVVSVSMLDESGESTPVAFRLEPSTDGESFTGEGLSQESADSELASAILASNPETVLTDDSGAYSIYLEDSFTGAVYITVTASADGDDSLVRCDSYTGCGTYDQAYTPELPNDGDLNIEFGEWFKADIELSVVKYIAPADADSGSALGDLGVTSANTANVSFLTSIISNLMLGSSVDSSAVSTSTLQAVIQILGRDAALTLAPVLADLSLSGGTDISSPDGTEELNASNLLMAQFSSAVQSMTGESINDLISTFSSAVTSGSSVDSDDASIAADDDDVASITASLQQAVTNTVNIFVAILSGDQAQITAALTAAYLANNPDASEADIAAYISETQAAVEASITAAIESGSATRESLLAAAEEAQSALETLGCTSDCEIDDAFYADLATTVTTGITASEVTLDSIEEMVITAQTDLETAQSYNAEGVIVDDASALAFTVAVDSLVAYSEAADLLVKTTRLFTTAQGYVSVADLLVTQNSDYQSIADSASDLLSGAESENSKVLTFNDDLADLVAEADAVKEEYDVVVASARETANSLYAAAMLSEETATAAEVASENAILAADVSLSNAEEAAAGLVLAEAAVVASSEFELAIMEFETALEQAISAATEYAGVAETDEDVDAAAELLASLEAYDTDAQSALATDQFAQAQALKLAAENAVAKFTVLESVVSTTDSVATMTVLTHTGTESVVDAADLIIDVIDEISDMGDNASGISARNENWTYDYSVDELRLSLTNETSGEMITANASYEGEKLVIAWGATLVAESGATIEFTTQDDTEAALTECVAYDTTAIVGSCLVVSFDSDVTADTVDDAEIVMTQSYNNVVITDGDSGFSGTLSHSTDETAMVDSVTLDGMSGDVDFSVMGTYNYADSEAEMDMIDIMVDSVAGVSAMGYHLSVMRTEGADFEGSISADYADSSMVFGTVTEIVNGISVTYIDETTIDYTDVTLVDMTK
ncbi:hypothetical protein J8L70_04620 [Pseudoalteromonas sp. MMG010]|uniref:hypothetical protein n=1 Tax=Pseudoalteromonas sp. MMG010 TaxID=2822685 RepID=UPI001B39E6AD|nr:hypothetical protein [Pseudoalteromonas sp. MMG010]MBQ4832519.1 hypothetical protein [Pseudoalteromonas sp. MMG010]